MRTEALHGQQGIALRERDVERSTTVDELTYRIEAEIEANHWWFVTRRKLLSRIIRELRVPPDASILDLGTSTGTNLRMLKDLNCRNAIGLDKSAEAIRYCAEKGLGTVEQGDVCDLPFEDGRFALVLATDIVEHVDDDVRALSEIRRVLAPGGTAVITVPAFESLWGVQDDVSHHKRRYRKRQLEARMRAAGLARVEVFYFNYLLFFPIWLARQLIHMLAAEGTEREPGQHLVINRVLTAIFTLDVRTRALGARAVRRIDSSDCPQRNHGRRRHARQSHRACRYARPAPLAGRGLRKIFKIQDTRYKIQTILNAQCPNGRRLRHGHWNLLVSCILSILFPCKASASYRLLGNRSPPVCARLSGTAADTATLPFSRARATSAAR